MIAFTLHSTEMDLGRTPEHLWNKWKKTEEDFNILWNANSEAKKSDSDRLSAWLGAARESEKQA